MTATGVLVDLAICPEMLVKVMLHGLLAVRTISKPHPTLLALVREIVVQELYDISPLSV
jgi:hypothetical protein